ncbi:methyl-accepting chemotaxis protein [Shewanella dokdonensis]|uniref:methyl-accepting chemotaxis protein n=1 Tax=Shewanella dokdonensis TaxID=712036 RepID=UPI00200BC0A5|nr:methyl-accepting chemotaxis protein [Shewanella dokdonensis]MCL1074245.1 methyl-accepting chemotaxis protein [Shewanella dokdonensis]
MKLNMATRVIAGFTVVILLLLILGAVSWLTNNELKQATQITQKLSLPALDATNALSESLSEQQRLIMVAFHTPRSSQLPDVKNKFEQQNSIFAEQYNTLIPLLQGRQEIQSILPEVNSSYQEFTGLGKRMMDNKLQALQLQENLIKTRDQLDSDADDAGSLLLDLVDLEDSNDTTKRDIAAAASAVDNSITSIVSTVYDLVATTEQSKYELINKELGYIIGEAQTKLEYINRHGEGVVKPNVLKDINQQTAGIFKMLQGADSIQQRKGKQVQLLLSTSQDLAQSEALKGNAVGAMKHLSATIEKLSSDINTDIINSIDSASINTLIVVIIAILVAIGVSIAVIRPLTAALKQINHALSVVASGDLTHRLDDSGHDEFAELSRNCNRLIDSLRKLITGILDRSNQLAAAAEETSAITSQTTISIQEQKGQVDQAATATTELNSSAQQVSLSADNALAQIKEADEQAQNMHGIADENRLTIESLANEVAKAAKVIDKVHADSGAIGSILDVIRGVAEQTNLLALNAAIEAARAGEQGRGFAVVADEVRSLASRTQQSTAEIQKMIEVLQQGTTEAVGVMEYGQSQAQLCVEKNEQSNKALQAISDSVHQAHDAGTQIASAAQEQNLVSQQVSEKLEHIALISEETATGADQTAQSIHQVARLAEELQSSVREFNV